MGQSSGGVGTLRSSLKYQVVPFHCDFRSGQVFRHFLYWKTSGPPAHRTLSATADLVRFQAPVAPELVCGGPIPLSGNLERKRSCLVFAHFHCSWQQGH